MPNPPTFNDLKRSRNLYNSSRGRRTVIGSIGLPSAITIPSLDPFNNEIVFFETQIDFTGSGNGLATEDGRLYGNSLLGDPSLSFNGNQFYSGATLSATTRYSQKSLFFVDNSFKSKSISFDYLLDQTKNYSLRREFYNTSGVETTSTYTISVFDYNDLNVSLSSNTYNVEGALPENVTEEFTKNITFTNILCTGRFLQDNVNFKVDYGDGNTSNVFDAINNILNHTYTFYFPFTGIKTVTLSTIRADGVYDIDTTTIPIQFKIAYTFPSPIITFRFESIQTTWQTISSVPDPEAQQDKFRFLNTPTTLSAEWNPDWWGYNSRDLYNFSGVTYKSDGWTAENNVVLITPKHGVCNEHWGSDPNPGDVGYFYNHTNGNAVSAEIESVLNTGTDDIRMVKFDRDLTTLGDIKVYKLPLFTNTIPANSLCTIYQGGNGPFGTGSSDRHAGLGTHNAITDVIDMTLFDTQIGKTDLWSVFPIFENTYFSLSSLAVGDSSSPTFIIIEDDILLASGFWLGDGRGPNYGLSAIQAVLSAGLETLGNTEGYVLSTVVVS